METAETGSDHGDLAVWAADERQRHEEAAYPSGVVQAPEGDAGAEPYHAAPALGLVEVSSDRGPEEQTDGPAEPPLPTSHVAISETLEGLAREGARRML